MRSLITVVIVAGVLAFLEEKTRKKEKRSKNSKNKIRMKLSFSYFFIGAIEAGMIGALLVWGELTNQLDTFLTIVGIAVAVPGLMLMIFPLTGVWEVLLDHDEITVTKCFVFKKHFLFSEITHCKQTKGGCKVYVKDRRRKAFFVDRYMDGVGLFMARIEAANIPVEEMIRDK